MKFNRVKGYRISVLVLIAVFLCSVFAVFTASRTGSAEETDYFESEYEIDTELTVPSTKITVGGTEYDAQTIIHFPSGSAYSSSAITLSERGQYRAEIYATVNGRVYREYEEFIVYDYLYEVEGGLNAAAVYEPSYLAPTVNGINVQLESGSVFYYNKLIDLEALGKDKAFITTFLAPQTVGEQDGQTLWFVLTDAYDSENQVRIKCSASRDGIDHGVTYIQAGASDQSTVGVEWNQGKVHEDNIYGFPINASFYGVPNSSASQDLSENGINLYFDTETNQLLSDQYRNISGGNGSTNVIIDLDDPEYFDNLFEGFTTGEVYLSIYAADLSKNTFGLEIKTIADHDLSVNKFIDDEEPEITVDFGDYEEGSLPQGLVDHAYPIFEASATDSYSDAELSVNVYYDYAGKKVDCYIEDGAFYPDKAGTYTIEYTATDVFGNPAIRLVEITVEETAPALTLTVETQDRVTEGYVGNEIEVSEATTSGGVGFGSVSISVIAPDGTESAVEDGYFIPRSEGTYTVKYTGTDYVRQQVIDDYEVLITLGEDPVFEGDVTLPRYFLTGYEYELPSFTAYNYTANGVYEIAASIRVRDGSGERTIGSDGKVTFTSSTAESVATITYSVQTATGYAEKTYEVPLFNVRTEDEIIMENYFQLTGFTTRSAESDHVTFGTASDHSTLTFINPILAEDLSITFLVNTAKNNYDTINVYLTDASNGDTLKFTYKRSSSESLFYINDGAMGYEITSSFTSSTGNEFQLRFDNEMSRVMGSSGSNYITVSSTVDGEPFSGFSDGYVYLMIELENVTGESEIWIKNINSQPMNSTTIDRVAPRLTVLGDHGGALPYGSDVVLNSIAYADVLDPNPSITLTVFAPDGTVVTSKDGLLLEEVLPDNYTITLDRYGVYSVEYTIEDASGRSRTMSYDIIVDDGIAPEISVGSIASTCKVGDVIVIPSVTVTDNETPAEEIGVYVEILTPIGRVEILPEGSNSFKADWAGTYTVYITARDAAGNIAIVEMTITAEEN